MAYRDYAEWELDLIYANGVLVGALGHYDCDGRTILRSHYGLKTAHGWEVDHIIPKWMGGTDHPSNLRPRHWEGNSRAGGILGAAIQRVDRWTF